MPSKEQPTGGQPVSGDGDGRVWSRDGAEGEVEVRWLRGLGSSPGGVDLMRVGPIGRIARAVTLHEALMASVVIDLLCPASRWYEIVSQLVPDPPAARWRS